MEAEPDFEDKLPPYAPTLAAFHRACAPTLRRIVGELPIREGDRVLDVPCGDGTYLSWLAERVGPRGRVVGAERNRPYLDVAHERLVASGHASRVDLIEAEIGELPFPEGSFDFVWCAHSLYSLPEPATVLRELKRVLRRGGALGIVENDSFHHWLLPWPVELELAVRRAQLVALEKGSRTWKKHYVGRRLATLLGEAGFTEARIVTHTIDHAAPLSPDERAMITDYLAGLRALTREELGPEARAALATVDGMLDRPDFVGSHLEIVATATNPVASPK